MPPKHYKYKAFISYSHQDKKWWDWLHKGMENYRVPMPTKSSPPKRLASGCSGSQPTQSDDHVFDVASKIYQLLSLRSQITQPLGVLT